MDDDFADIVLDDDYDPASLNPSALKRAVRKATLERVSLLSLGAKVCFVSSRSLRFVIIVIPDVH